MDRDLLCSRQTAKDCHEVSLEEADRERDIAGPSEGSLKNVVECSEEPCPAGLLLNL
jgi:hypothetical protein